MAENAEVNGYHNEAEENRAIKVGSRKSQLALVQTEWVISELSKLDRKRNFEIIKISTIGDKILNQPLSKIGEKSLFTKELEIALENKEVDFVVHSLKDLPTTLPDGMVIGAICCRADPSDALVMASSQDAKSLTDLKAGSTVGTSSLRRIAQLSRLYPNLNFRSIRGNLNTRLSKLEEGRDYAALVLAAAGMKRLGWEKRITQLLPASDCMHAVGQGALAVECRSDDSETLSMLESLCHRETTLCCIAERSFMKQLGGGCSVPIAVNTKLENSFLELIGGVFSLDGKVEIISSLNVELTSEPVLKKIKRDVNYCGVVAGSKTRHFEMQLAQQLGQNLAHEFLEKGAKQVLDDARAMNNNP